MKKRLSTKSLTPKTIKPILFATFLIAVFSQIVLADDTNVVKNLLKERFDDIIAVMENKDLDDETKKGRIEDIIKPIFDFPLMAMLALGKASWTAMTKEDQERFSELFTKILKQAYFSKILAYVDEDIIIEESHQIDKKVYIHTFIVSKDQKIPVLYKFYQSDTAWKIYDIEVEGVSLIQTYRSQFTESLQEMTAKALMVKMEELISSQ